MRTYLRAGAFLLLLILVLGSVSPAAYAAGDTERISDATVNLYCRIKLGGRTYSSTGSGVMIDSRGVILTNAHVARYFALAEQTGKSKTSCTVRTGSPAKDTYTATLLFVSPDWVSAYTESVERKESDRGTGERDIALLFITGTKKKKGTLPSAFPTLPLASVNAVETSEDTIVSVAGYPAGNKSFDEIRRALKQVVVESTVTDVRAFTRPHADLILIAPSEASQSGVSGGPVVDRTETVLGIATAVGNDKEEFQVLRAVTSVHVNRTIAETTGLTLAEFLSGDLKVRLSTGRALLGNELRAGVEKELRRLPRR